ncbi:MAG: hypothetical protein AAF721_17775 [Myxococcota bacterium]
MHTDGDQQTVPNGQAWGRPVLVEPLIRAADGTLSLGRYVLHHALEQNGYSLLYGGYDPEAGREVSIELQATTTQDQAEALAAANRLVGLSDPHVLGVREVGAYADARDAESVGVFLVMQPVHGLTFDRWLDARPRATRTGSEVDQVVSIFAQAGRGMAAAHTGGLVHGSFTASSIIVGYDGRARLRGFGQDPMPSLTPETEAGMPPSAWSDQYAFCKALQDALRQVSIKIPRRIARVLAKGMSPNAQDRFGSMNLLVEALTKAPLLRFRAASVGAAGFALLSIADALRG